MPASHGCDHPFETALRFKGHCSALLEDTLVLALLLPTAEDTVILRGTGLSEFAYVQGPRRLDHGMKMR